MNRRTFAGLGMAAAAGAAEQAAPQSRTRRVFLCEQYFLKQGTQPARLHQYLEKGLLPAYARLGAGPALALEAVMAPHMPQVTTVVQFDSLEQFAALRVKATGDKALMQAFEEWEAGPEQPYEHSTSTVLEATAYCPPLQPDREPRKASRYFEVRVYHSPTGRQLRALHERFAGPEIKIFHRTGVHPILYSSTLFGENKPNLTYVIPFESLDAREKAWAAFGADPEWVKVRKESIDRSGQISSVSQISLYRATPYSPIR